MSIIKSDMVLFFVFFFLLAVIGRIDLNDVNALIFFIVSLCIVVFVFLFYEKNAQMLFFISVSLLLCIYLIFSAFSSSHILSVTYGLNKITIGMLFPLLLACCLVRLTVDLDIYHCVFWMSLLIIIIGLMYKLPFGFFDRQVRYGFFGPITYGWFVGFWLISLNYLVLTLRARVLLTSIGILLLFWTGSKGPLFAYFLTLIMFHSRSLFYVIFRFEVALLSLALLALFWNFGLDITNTRIYKTTLAFLDGSVESDRLNMLLIGLEFVKSNYVLGTGFGSWLSLELPHKYPHNIIVELFAEGGLLAVTYLVVVCLILLKYCASPSIVFFSIFVLFFSGDFSYLRYFVFFSVLFLSYNKLHNS